MSHKEDWQTGPDLQRGPESAESYDDVTRALPHALMPEKSILSSMMQDPNDFIPVAQEEKLTKSHFYLPAHSTLFAFLTELFEAGKEIELVSLVQKLLDRGLLDRVGGPSALADLYSYAPSGGHFRHHMNLVKEKFILREIISVSNESIAAAYDSPEEGLELLDSMERSVMAIRGHMETEKAQTIITSVDEVMDAFQRLLEGESDGQGIPTGYEELDAKTGGLKPGDFVLVGARPSMGKTSFLMNIIEHMCVTDGRPCLVFSAEMTYFQITQRMIFSRAGMCYARVRNGYRPNQPENQAIATAAREIRSSKLYVNPASGPTINYIRAVARRHKRDHGIQAIGIDYIQLLKSVSKQAQNSYEREISEISAGLKNLAKDIEIPIIALAQLNRGSETQGKAPREPRMSDLRSSGSLEQDADIVGLLNRPEYYADTQIEKDALKGKAQLNLAKNRNGETGIIPLHFNGSIFRFENAAPQTEQEEAAPALGKRW